MADILGNANDILVDLNGEINYLQDDTLWIYDNADSELIGAQVVFNNSDLGEPGIEKLINFVDVIFKSITDYYKLMIS